MRDETSTHCVAIVPTQGKNYRKIAKENWGLEEWQMVGMHVHHRIPVSEGGSNDPSNLYVCSPWFHSNIWHGDSGGFIGIATEAGRKGGRSKSKAKLHQIERLAEQKRGSKLSAKHRENLRKNAKGCSSPEHAKSIGNALRGKPKTKEHRQNLSVSRMGTEPWNKGKKQPVVTCPHCRVEGGSSTMRRWHFDNCKHKQ